MNPLVRKVIGEADEFDAKDYLLSHNRFVLTVNDFVDRDDWLNALWALGKLPRPITSDEAPLSLWNSILPVKVGEGGYFINRDIIRNWPDLMSRLGEPQDLDEIAIAPDK